jgi:catechol 2,3-dioxygenase-like lactoylglutathione lyase family enzyme
MASPLVSPIIDLRPGNRTRCGRRAARVVDLPTPRGSGTALPSQPVAAAHLSGQGGAHGWPIAPHSGGFELCVYTDDVDAAVEELRSHGVLVLAEPATQPWNERMAYVADPDDHPVMICQKL